MRSLRNLFLIFSLLLTWVLNVYHHAVHPDPIINKLDNPIHSSSQWLPKENYGINQLILHGTPFQRGYFTGLKTKKILDIQEYELHDQLSRFIPNLTLQKVFFFANMVWFNGVEDYFEPWMLKEMFGVSKHANNKFDYVANKLSRQIAYHGIHEVGQLFVDEEIDDFGCTVFAVPYKNDWVIGRNFDFEAGRIFDEEKVLKWVFPDKGHSYLSVIFPGMVGVITGVNEHGLYISLNAAGSEDFERYATPTILITRNVLQFAKNYKEALKIIEKSPQFITEIFFLVDSKNKKAFTIEKSPKKMGVIPVIKPSIVTNHLQAPIWKNDRFNKKRIQRLTTMNRFLRGKELLNSVPDYDLMTNREINLKVLSYLRDKKGLGGQKLHLAHRNTIDSLVATHSIILNTKSEILYISKGPAINGPFLGYDLKKSFKEKRPAQVDKLPADPLVSKKLFYKIKKSLNYFAKAKNEIKNKNCIKANNFLELSKKNFFNHSNFYSVLGDYEYSCNKNKILAKENWQKALNMKPAYRDKIEKLRKKVNL